MTRAGGSSGSMRMSDEVSVYLEAAGSNPCASCMCVQLNGMSESQDCVERGQVFAIFCRNQAEDWKKRLVEAGATVSLMGVGGDVNPIYSWPSRRSPLDSASLRPMLNESARSLRALHPAATTGCTRSLSAELQANSWCGESRSPRQHQEGRGAKTKQRAEAYSKAKADERARRKHADEAGAGQQGPEGRSGEEEREQQNS